MFADHMFESRNAKGLQDTGYSFQNSNIFDKNFSMSSSKCWIGKDTTIFPTVTKTTLKQEFNVRNPQNNRFSNRFKFLGFMVGRLKTLRSVSLKQNVKFLGLFLFTTI